MSDDAFDELEKIQDLIIEKLAEIGIELQGPVSFAKIPGGPKIVQLPAGILADTSQVQAAIDADDEFAQIVEAQRLADMEEKKQKEREDVAKMFEGLDKLSKGVLDIDVEDHGDETGEADA